MPPGGAATPSADPGASVPPPNGAAPVPPGSQAAASADPGASPQAELEELRRSKLNIAPQYETGGSSGQLSVSRSCRSRLPSGVRTARSNPAVRCHTVAPRAGHVGDAQLGRSSSAVPPFEISRTASDLEKRPVSHAG
ncbi:uncharacterized protein SAZU_1799 [Streptomyces azureus]|uniref:Uncharacterized protein n=1 Tax=Streptomyces azureus TaxID=146537 RepID=A0A0K8PGP5_STRAJ|nr:uncharacterized protein SAZU_1799 [Streptomyces azureus]